MSIHDPACYVLPSRCYFHKSHHSAALAICCYYTGSKSMAGRISTTNMASSLIMGSLHTSKMCTMLVSKQQAQKQHGGGKDQHVPMLRAMALPFMGCCVECYSHFSCSYLLCSVLRATRLPCFVWNRGGCLPSTESLRYPFSVVCLRYPVCQSSCWPGCSDNSRCHSCRDRVCCAAAAVEASL